MKVEAGGGVVTIGGVRHNIAEAREHAEQVLEAAATAVVQSHTFERESGHLERQIEFMREGKHRYVAHLGSLQTQLEWSERRARDLQHKVERLERDGARSTHCKVCREVVSDSPVELARDIVALLPTALTDALLSDNAVSAVVEALGVHYGSVDIDRTVVRTAIGQGICVAASALVARRPYVAPAVVELGIVRGAPSKEEAEDEDPPPGYAARNALLDSPLGRERLSSYRAEPDRNPWDDLCLHCEAPRSKHTDSVRGKCQRFVGLFCAGPLPCSSYNHVTQRVCTLPVGHEGAHRDASSAWTVEDILR